MNFSHFLLLPQFPIFLSTVTNNKTMTSLFRFEVDVARYWGHLIQPFLAYCYWFFDQVNSSTMASYHTSNSRLFDNIPIKTISLTASHDIKMMSHGHFYKVIFRANVNDADPWLHSMFACVMLLHYLQIFLLCLLCICWKIIKKLKSQCFLRQKIFEKKVVKFGQWQKI